jgi:hypothetical protein
MKVINGALQAVAPCENVPGSANQDYHADGQEDSHQCPENGHKYDATTILKDSNQDQVAVEGQPGFLDLQSSSEQCNICIPGTSTAYQPCHVGDRGSNNGPGLWVISIEGVVAESICDSASS